MEKYRWERDDLLVLAFFPSFGSYVCTVKDKGKATEWYSVVNPATKKSVERPTNATVLRAQAAYSRNPNAFMMPCGGIAAEQ